MVQSNNTNDDMPIHGVSMKCLPVFEGNHNSNNCTDRRCYKNQTDERSKESCDALTIAEILQKFRESPFVNKEDETQMTMMEEGPLKKKGKECCNYQDIDSSKEMTMTRDFTHKSSIYSQGQQTIRNDHKNSVRDDQLNVITPLFSPVHTPPHNSFAETATQSGKSVTRELPALCHIVHFDKGNSCEATSHAMTTLIKGRIPGETNVCYSYSFNQIQPILPRTDSKVRTCLDILQQLNNTLRETRLPIATQLQDNINIANHHPNYSKPKICRMEGCSNSASKRSPYCTQHGGVRKCEHPSCQKCAQGQTRFCIAHGGGRRCTYPNCTKAARDQRFCAAHGGGRRCCETGCHKLAVGRSNKCTAHGGGRRCQAESCNKAAQSRSNYCVRHGGGRKCIVQGCAKVARGKTMLCMSHARMKASIAPASAESPPNLCHANN